MSVIAGSVVILLSLLGCLGSCRRKKVCLYLFGVAVVLLFALLAGMASIVWETEATLDAWKENGFTIYPRENDTAVLSAGNREILHTVYVDMSAALAYCTPNASTYAAAAAAVASGGPPPGGASLQCATPSMEPFAGWVNQFCLEPSELAGEGSARRLAQIGACRADVRRGAADGSFASHAALDGDESGFFFCACAEPMVALINGSWVTPVRIAFLAICIYFVLLLLLLCGACRGAAKAKKRRKKHEFEMVVMEARMKEASGESQLDEGQPQSAGPDAAFV